MSRFHSYVNSAASILHSYKGDQPFNIFIKDFFAQQKKYGSRDRKQISQLCYSYFRIGQALQALPIEERILAGLFLCENMPNQLLEQLKPEWNELIALPHEGKSSLLNFSTEEIFPWSNELSSAINIKDLAASFLVQPDLFLRIRPGKGDIVKQKLKTAGINFNEISHSCLSLDNAVKVDDVVELDAEVVVQDYNSQRVGEFITFVKDGLQDSASTALRTSTALKVYDCCAASGGKAILAYDVLKNINLTVSDIRESIIANLKKRFSRAGIKEYNSFIQDLTASTNFLQRMGKNLPGRRSFIEGGKPQTSLGPEALAKVSNVRGETFDLVICDAPCTGSGTWSRNPEQLYYFKPEKIGHYSDLQKTIAQNVIPFVMHDGFLLYITCSVFRKENEEVVEFLMKEYNLTLKKMELLKGYDKRADSLFAALLQKS